MRAEGSGTEKWLRAAVLTALAATLALGCDDGVAPSPAHSSAEAGAGGASDVAVGDAGGAELSGEPAPSPQYVGLSDSSSAQGFGPGGGGEGGTGEQLPLGPPYGTSTMCGDAIVGSDEECDDGAGGADACTAECQTQDQAAGPAPTEAVPSTDRYLGAGRHPVSGLEEGFITTYVQAGGDEPAIGATVFNIWGQPAHSVTVSDGASPIYEANPVAAALPSGRYVVAWGDFDGDGSDLGIAFREVSGDGDLGSLRVANAGAEFSQLNPDLLWTGSQLIVAWEDYADPFNGPDLRYRVFDEELSAVSSDLALAESALPEAAVALTAFDGGWAAAYREGAADGSENIVVKVGDDTFRIGPVYGGPLDDRPALVELDETHLLLVFSAGTDPGTTGIYNVPRLRYSVIDTAGSLTPGFQSFDPLDDVVTREAQTSQLSPAAAQGSDGIYVAWRSEARSSDAAGDQLWLKYLRWQPSVEPQLDVREAEALLPRICEGSVGDQRTPALARIELPAFGALAMAWDDYGKRQGQGEPDVVVHYAPTHPRDPAYGEIFEEPWTGTNGSDWSSHWSLETLTGTNAATLERERGKVSSPGGTGSALLRVNHHAALNVDISTDLSFNFNGVQGGIVARRADEDPDSYLAARFGTNNSDSSLRIFAMIDNVKTDIATTPLPANFTSNWQGLYFRMRFRVTTVDGAINVATKYWMADLPEPTTWMLESTVAANTPIAMLLANRPGRFGLLASNGISGVREITFDNFHAVFFEGSVLGDVNDPIAPPAPLRRGKAEYRPCTDVDRCGAGEGCCFDSTECATGLTCTPAPSTQTPWKGLGSHARTCAAPHCSNQTVDEDEVWVDCGGADCAPCKCAPTASPGSSSYCQTGCPCGAGGVDCTTTENCVVNMVCAQEAGYKYGFVNGSDACTPSHCRNHIVDGDEPDTERPDWGGSCGSPDCNTVNGSYAHCSVFCKCANGHGDCSLSDTCVTGTNCIQNKGAKFGLGSGVDICLVPHCSNNVLDAALGETAIDCGNECGCQGPCAGAPCPP